MKKLNITKIQGQKFHKCKKVSTVSEREELKLGTERSDIELEIRKVELARPASRSGHQFWATYLKRRIRCQGDQVKGKWKCHSIPYSDEVMWPVNLKQGEVQFDTRAWSHCDQPGAISRAGVLLWVSRRENGPIVWGDVPTTGDCKTKLWGGELKEICT